MSIAQGRNGYVSFGGSLVPVYDWNIQSPRNLVAPTPVGNSWVTNHAEGLRTSRFVANIMVREKATEVLAQGWWDRFLTRTWSGGFDDTPTTTIIASNAKKTFTLTNAKAESFVLTCALGMPIGLQVVFVAPSKPAKADVTPAAYAPVDASPPLMFDKVTLGGITGNCYGFEITYANNHLPNGPLNGTKSLSSWDAGVYTCGAKFTFDARAAASEPFADDANITISLAGAATRLFSLTDVVPNDPDDANANVGQAFLTYNCLVKGNTTTPPLVVS